MAKVEVIREYAGRIEYLDSFNIQFVKSADDANFEEAKALAIAKGGYIVLHTDDSPANVIILFEAEGRTHFYDDIGDTSWWEED